MKLIVGLGNPGSKYSVTRHNAGFIALDRLASQLDASFSENKKLKAEIAKTAEVIMLKPQTFMNLSGLAVKLALDYYKIDINDLIVLHDDLDIDQGKFKTTTSSRAAGHNGVQSIIDELGSQDFRRYRIGIRPAEPSPIPTEKFVLSRFEPSEIRLLETPLEAITSEIKKILQ
jgi:peptidyl-tRNA hydrolase, PTH1 family